MSRTVKLEQVLKLVVNEERDAAKQLLHKFFVETAKDLHREMMIEDEEGLDDTGISDSMNELEAEEDMFEEDDLDVGDESGEPAPESEEGEGDDAIDVGDFDADEDGAETELAGDISGDDGVDMEDEGSVEDRLASVEEELESLHAELEKILGQEDGEGMDMDADASLDGGSDFEDPELSGSGTGEDDFETDDFGGEGFEDDDEFQDVAESKMSDFVQKVGGEYPGNNKVNGEVGKGGSITQNNTSPLPQKKIDQRVNGAAPVKIKSDQVKGYPDFNGVDSNAISATTKTTTTVKSRANTLKKANDALETVATPKSGEGKPVGAGGNTASMNTKSPIGGQGTVNRGSGERI